MSEYEWTDPKHAMYAAIEELTFQIINLPKCEESALTEAKATRRQLKNKMKDLSMGWLIDRLHQSAVDLEVNDPKRNSK